MVYLSNSSHLTNFNATQLKGTERKPPTENRDLAMSVVQPGADCWAASRKATGEKKTKQKKLIGQDRMAGWAPEVRNQSTSHQNARWQQLVSRITVLKLLHAWETRPFVRITRRGKSKTGHRGRSSRPTWLASKERVSKIHFHVTGEFCVSCLQQHQRFKVLNKRRRKKYCFPSVWVNEENQNTDWQQPGKSSPKNMKKWNCREKVLC